MWHNTCLVNRTYIRQGVFEFIRINIGQRNRDPVRKHHKSSYNVIDYSTDNVTGKKTNKTIQWLNIILETPSWSSYSYIDSRLPLSTTIQLITWRLTVSIASTKLLWELFLSTSHMRYKSSYIRLVYQSHSSWCCETLIIQTLHFSIS